MSDLLTRLAQRALGTAAPAVQPRLPSRFADAPGDAAPSLLREEAAEVEAFAPRIAPSPRPAPAAAHPSPAPVVRRGPDAVPPPPVDAAPRHPAEPPAVRPVVPAAGIEQAVERVDDAHRPRTAVPPPSEPRTAAPAAPLPVDTDPPRRPASAPPAHPVEAAGEARDGGPVRVVVEAADDDELLMPRRAARPRAVAEEREDAVKEHAPGAALPAREADGGSVEAAGVAAPGAEDAEPDADSAGAQPRAAGRGSVVRPEAVRVAERPVSPTAAEPAAARPVVRVTIGRIEVRAAPPPAQPQPAAKPGWTPPVLSLGDYLKREAGR